MNQGGRPKVFLGCKREHLRVRFERLGKSRGLYARWRANLGLWEWQISGYGIKPLKGFCPSRGMLLANCRLRSSVSPLDGWRWIHVDQSTDWGQGFDALGAYIVADVGQLPSRAA